MISDYMGTVAVLLDFNKIQNITTRELEICISETARLVSCSHAEIVSAYRMWCMDGETANYLSVVCVPQSSRLRIRRVRKAATVGITKSRNHQQIAFLNIQCCVWAIAADGLSFFCANNMSRRNQKHLQWEHEHRY